MKIGPEQHAPILIMQQNMDYVEKFPYIGSYMSSDGDSGLDVRSRIGKAILFMLIRWSKLKHSFGRVFFEFYIAYLCQEECVLFV